MFYLNITWVWFVCVCFCWSVHVWNLVRTWLDLGFLEEFLAHSANVNCLSIGKKTSGLLITGGDDYKVNLWAIGKPTSLMVTFHFFSLLYICSLLFIPWVFVSNSILNKKKMECFYVLFLSCLQSLCGHASEVDSVAFDSAEVLVLAGASSGLIKLWDLEEAKS